jgi:toxin ParE1/3/4
MTYTVRLREEAERDLEEAASWYESQRTGLGHDFLDTVLEMTYSIEQNPLSYPVVYRDTHRAVLPRFPFAVFYIVQDAEISVISVMHGSRDPSIWQRRT